MIVPTVVGPIGNRRCWGSRALFRRVPCQALVHTLGVVVVPEGQKLLLQVSGMPIEPLVQALLPKGTHESLDEGMRNRNSRHGRDRFDA